MLDFWKSNIIHYIMELSQLKRINKFYHHQSKIYDLTRWIFLFDRLGILNKAKTLRSEMNSILDVGCGTGYSLKHLSKLYPQSNIIGVDVSESMLEVTRKKIKQNENIQLIQSPFPSEVIHVKQFDMILFSYSLSMFNPGWEDALIKASEQLSENGLIVLIDFHSTHSVLFKRWMEWNQVRLDQHLLPKAESLFNPVLLEVNSVYFGLWSYFIFIGIKK